LPSVRLLGTGFVPKHSLQFHKRSVDGSGKCNIEIAGTGVHVAVYELSVAEKGRLDEIEGVGRGYRDSVIDVPGFSDCATYMAEDGYKDDSLRPYGWYRELVLLGCRYHGFPKEYVARVSATESISDPDVERREQNKKLVERISRS
jgi:hypothetical protein